MNAWVCPKCSRVWGPFVMQCAPCNSAIVTGATMPRKAHDLPTVRRGFAS